MNRMKPTFLFLALSLPFLALLGQNRAGEGLTIEVRRISDRVIVLNLTGIPQSTNIIALFEVQKSQEETLAYLLPINIENVR